MTNKMKQAKNGFTLIETLVAVMILSIAIAGPLTIASKGLQSSIVAKDQTTAYYLAQDAIEFARFARDSNRLAGQNWLLGPGSGSTDLGPCTSADGSASCYLDSLANTPSAPTSCGGACGILYWNNTNHYYTYSSVNNTPTLFTRTISIITPVAGNAGEANITVKVTWSDIPGVTHTVNIKENLYDWE
jgi:prepilin-type N-terminal cleavage/methylation domain-containing protein